MKSKNKLVCFSVIWVLLLLSCLGIKGEGLLPYCVAGGIGCLLLVLWVFPHNIQVIKICRNLLFILSITIFICIFAPMALFFGYDHPQLFLPPTIALLACASCGLIKPMEESKE